MSTLTTAREENEAIRRGPSGKKGSRSKESYGTLEMRQELGPWSMNIRRPQRESGWLEQS